MRDQKRRHHATSADSEPVQRSPRIGAGAPIMRHAAHGSTAADVGTPFAHAMEGSSGAMPLGAEMERAFGDPATEASCSGDALPAATRRDMERAFQTDFSDVRVHQGPQAEAVGAMAYAQGHDLHFAPGAYDPSSQSGRELIGHELTHVVQQRAGVVSTPQGKDAEGPAINADPALEAEADRLGAAAARGQTVSVSGAGGGIQPKMAPGAVIQCGNAHGGNKKRSSNDNNNNNNDRRPPPGKEEEDESPGMSEEERSNAIKSVYDRLSDLALKLIRAEESSLKFWKDGDLKKEWNWMDPAVKLAVGHDAASSLLSELVLSGVCGDLSEARQAILDECKRRFGKGGGPAPQIAHMSRLMPGVQMPTEEDRLLATKFSVVEGHNPQKQAIKLKQLDLQGLASGALDQLHLAAQQSVVAAPPGGVTLPAVITSTLAYYVGPRESGHEIWVLVQATVTSLCTDAQAAGYPIWDPAVQQAIAHAATRYAEANSTGSWAADREDQGATTKR